MGRPRGNLIVPKEGLEFVTWVEQAYVKSDPTWEQVMVEHIQLSIFGEMQMGDIEQ